MSFDLRQGQMVSCINEQFHWCSTEPVKPHKGMIYTISGFSLCLSVAMQGQGCGLLLQLEEFPGGAVHCQCGKCPKAWEVENFRPVEKDFTEDVKKLLAPDPNAPVGPEPVTV